MMSNTAAKSIDAGQVQSSAPSTHAGEPCRQQNSGMFAIAALMLRNELARKHQVSSCFLSSDSRHRVC
jgi:hypothetical protein